MLYLYFFVDIFLHILSDLIIIIFFFFNDTATTEIYTLSLHDALPISAPSSRATCSPPPAERRRRRARRRFPRSEEHTSELQSRQYLVCRLLLEKKKTRKTYKTNCLTSNVNEYESTATTRDLAASGSTQ